MKKVFIFLLFVFDAVFSFAQCNQTVLQQNNWRWRNNDGNETTATWKAPEKSTIVYSNGVLRLRVEILNRSLINVGIPECRYRSVQPLDTLQYSTDTSNAGLWKNIGNDLSKAFKLVGANALVGQNVATTTQIAGSSASFSPGKVMVSDSVNNSSCY